jgi:basic membrane protein A
VAGAGSAANGSGQMRVGLVLEQPLVGPGNDPFQYGAYQGLVRAARNLPIQAKAVAPSPTGIDTYAAPFDWLARQHYNLVIAVGFLELAALSQSAHQFPHRKFAVLDATNEDVPGSPKNVEGVIFRSEQVGYLAGFLAAKMADRRGPAPHVVGSVGGIDLPSVESYMAGFQAGAKAADPKITVLNTFSNSFTSKAYCASAARAQIDKGSTVVFNVAGECGLGALKAAQQRGVYGIGVDTDQSKLGHYILTSAIKNLNLAVYQLSEELVQGRLPTGGNLSFDLRNHGVYLGKFSPLVPRSLRRELRPLERRIKQGKIHIPTRLSQ